MLYYSINNPKEKVSLREAVLKSISGNSGLYMPSKIPKLPAAFFKNLHRMSLKEIAFEVSKSMLGDDVPSSELKKIIEVALSFPIPLKKLNENLFVLELFHGPTLAFKDVGARFMAGLFEYFLANENREVIILVATSGDTGSAIANAFFNKKGVKVVILYPSGKVSPLQEKQLTTMGGNITALEVKGNFDDCQDLVKKAFSDEKINRKINLTSANSINFGRLLPQTFYYFHAVAQLGKNPKRVVISVPSGNFGNLTAGLIAKKMGLPVYKFIAATNKNHSVPDFLKSGKFKPGKTVFTISNAMDVGNPSNFSRMLYIYKGNAQQISYDIKGLWYNDNQTRQSIGELYKKYSYQPDPHGAIAYAGLNGFGLTKNQTGIFLETAHPAKFPMEVEKSTGKKVTLPSSLKKLLLLKKKAIKISKEFSILKKILLELE